MSCGFGNSFNNSGTLCLRSCNSSIARFNRFDNLSSNRRLYRGFFSRLCRRRGCFCLFSLVCRRKLGFTLVQCDDFCLNLINFRNKGNYRSSGNSLGRIRIFSRFLGNIQIEGLNLLVTFCQLALNAGFFTRQVSGYRVSYCMQEEPRDSGGF